MWALALVLVVGVPTVAASPAYATGTISGTVTNDSAEQLDGTICTQPVGSGSCGGSFFTGGAFNITEEPGDYYLRVIASSMDGYSAYYKAGDPDGVPLVEDATPVTITEGGTFSFDLVLPTIATLSGHVTTSAGGPAANLPISRNRLGQVKSTTTDATGFYDFGYVLAGSYTVSTGALGNDVGASVPYVVPASGDLTLDLQLTAAASLEGTVTDEETGLPAPFVEVQVFRKTPLQYAGGATTDATGHYLAEGLPEGDVVLRYEDRFEGFPNQYSGNAAIIADAEAIALAEGATATYDDALFSLADPMSLPHTLSGVVTDAADDPLRGIAVTATGPGGDLSTVADRQGRWALNTPDGSFTLRFEPNFGWEYFEPGAVPWLTEYYADAWVPTDSQPVVVAGAPVDGLDVSLARAARVKVHVAGPSGAAVDAGLTLVDGSGARFAAPEWIDYSTESYLVRPGSYRALVTGSSAPGTPLLPQWYGGQGADPAAATPLDLLSQSDVDLGTVALPSALAATVAPVVAGTRKPGRTLTIGTGTWNQQDGLTFAYRWTRGTKVVGTGPSYVVRAGDLGSTLRARLSATTYGLAGHSTVDVEVPKGTTTVRAKGSSPSPGKVRLVVRVTSPGARPTGRVVVRQGREVLGRLRLRRGVATLVLPDQPAGRQTYTLAYAGNARFQPDRGRVRVTVG